MKILMINLILLMVITFSGCARFRVSDLSKSTVITIPITKNNYSGVFFNQSGGVYEAIPGRVGIKDNLIIFPEASKKQIKFFKDRKMFMILQSHLFKEEKSENMQPYEKIDVKKSDSLNIPGKIVIGDNDDFFVENYDPVISKDVDQKESYGFYRILHFDINGNFLGLIGRKGQNELPFDNVMWMDTDTEGSLWVFYRQLDELNLDQYGEGNLLFSISEKECYSYLYENEKSENLFSHCEYMYPFNDGSKILLVGRTEKRPEEESKEKGYIFQYRTFKILDLDEKKAYPLMNRMNDPEDFPFLPYDDKHILIWQTRAQNIVRFAMYSIEGNLTNNLQIEFDGLIHNWRRTYYTLKGEFYSIRVFKKKLKIYRWS